MQSPLNLNFERDYIKVLEYGKIEGENHKLLKSLNIDIKKEKKIIIYTV